MEKIKSKAKTFVSVMAFILLISGISYAFLMAQLEENISSTLELYAYTVDGLLFQKSNDISFKIGEFNFDENMGDKSDTLTLTATLTANNKTYQALYDYNVYFNITKNEFDYTTSTLEPEIILHVEGPEGEVQQLKNLYYYPEYEGFDITNFEGVISIKENYPIEVKNEKENPQVQNWVFTVTVRNLPTDQFENSEKKFNAQGILQRTQIISDYKLDNYLKYQTKIDDNFIYHGNGIGAADNSYRYSGSYDEVNNFICFGPGSESYNNGTEEICPDANKYRIIGLFPNEKGKYKVKVIKNDYLTSKEIENESVGSVSYNINEQAKYHGSQLDIQGFHWNNDDYVNDWDQSILKHELNDEENSYLHYLGDWANKIDDTVWHVQGVAAYEPLNEEELNYNTYTVNDYYQRELGSLINKSELEKYPDVTAKIGLMYVSEYGYAASQIYWNEKLLRSYSSDENSYSNWMFNGTDEWTISRAALSTGDVYIVSYYDGSVTYEPIRNRNALSVNGVRPTFSLKNDVRIIDDDTKDGSSEHPYRLKA